MTRQERIAQLKEQVRNKRQAYQQIESWICNHENTHPDMPHHRKMLSMVATDLIYAEQQLKRFEIEDSQISFAKTLNKSHLNQTTHN